MKSYVISWLILYGRHVITMVLAGATFFKIVLLLSVIMSNERYMKHTTYRGVKPKSPRSINHTAININCCQDGALQINTHLTTSVSFVVIAECICKGPLNLRKKKTPAFGAEGKILELVCREHTILLLCYSYFTFTNGLLTCWQNGMGNHVDDHKRQ